MNDTFMKTKPVFPLLVSMALPNVISMLVNSLYNIVDSLFVAQINEQAMTALSLVFPIQNFVNAVAIGFGIGINALVALYRGAGDHDRADAAATHGMALSVLHGILCTLQLPPSCRLPGRFTADGTIVSMGVTYSTIVFLFATVNMASLAFEKLFQAVGRMKLTMIALISGCVCNILLDPVLIFGLGPVPAMGIAGAALATGIGQAATLIIYLVVYSTTESPVHLRRKALRPDLSLEGRLYAIGVPAILNLALPPCWSPSSTACWRPSPRAMWWCWASTISSRRSSICPPTASCRECAPSSATTTVQKSTPAWQSSTSSPSA